MQALDALSTMRASTGGLAHDPRAARRAGDHCIAFCLPNALDDLAFRQPEEGRHYGKRLIGDRFDEQFEPTNGHRMTRPGSTGSTKLLGCDELHRRDAVL